MENLKKEAENDWKRRDIHNYKATFCNLACNHTTDSTHASSEYHHIQLVACVGSWICWSSCSSHCTFNYSCTEITSRITASMSWLPPPRANTLLLLLMLPSQLNLLPLLSLLWCAHSQMLDCPSLQQKNFFKTPTPDTCWWVLFTSAFFQISAWTTNHMKACIHPCTHSKKHTLLLQFV